MLNVTIATGIKTGEFRVISKEIAEITKNDPDRDCPLNRGIVFSRTVNPLRLESLRVRDTN